MGHAAQVTAQSHAADVEAQLHALLDALVNDTAHQGDKDTLGLVLLHQLHALLSGGGSADDDSHAGDVPGNQRHAQLTDLGVGEVAHDGLLVGAAAVGGPLHQLDHLGGQGGSDAGGENILGAVVAGHEILDGGLQGLLGLAHGGHLPAGHGVEAGQAGGGIAKGSGGFGPQFGQGLVHGLDRKSVHFVVAGENSLEQCLHLTYHSLRLLSARIFIFQRPFLP